MLWWFLEMLNVLQNIWNLRVAENSDNGLANKFGQLVSYFRWLLFGIYLFILNQASSPGVGN